jgi:hypothetical protein
MTGETYLSQILGARLDGIDNYVIGIVEFYAYF